MVGSTGRHIVERAIAAAAAEIFRRLRFQGEEDEDTRDDVIGKVIIFLISRYEEKLIFKKPLPSRKGGSV
jgi:hypothetical protein